ncbi:MAG TPA: M3 family oligoendopeptidase [Anaerolineae bacterium]|nr:M3 family oligoendopeptidase [Anaerolineae bacterium]
MQETREKLEGIVQNIESVRAKLAPDMAEGEFVKILDDLEQATRLISRLYGYGLLRFTGDTQDQKAQTYFGQVQQLLAEFENRTLFFTLWWKSLEDEQAERFMSASVDYQYWLEAVRLEKPYTLSEPEEKVINIKNVNGPKALYNLYESITNRYTFKLEVEGEVKELTRGELAVYVFNPDPDLRAAAYKELFRVYDEDVTVLGQIYQYLLRDWHSENLGLRGYTSPIAVRNLSNDVPDDVIDSLLEVCRTNAPLFQRYFQLKARWLGIDQLRRYDIYATVVKTEKIYDYSDAAQMVFDSLHQFDPSVEKMAKRVLGEHHYDSEIRKGKQSGAFSLTIEPGLTPWIKQSYQGQLNDLATMAHELGHAIHSMLAEHHTALTQSPSLPLAETASTFCEMLLTDYLLDQDPDPEVQRDLLFRQMDDAYATIMRQAYFALFERSAHEKVHEGASVDDLSRVYFENLQEQFGDSLDLTDDFRQEWIAIPHFFDRPFYVYAYAFGQLLVLSLYQQYLQEGESFKPRYLEILAAGGSASPVRILERAGIDIRSADFWQGGFDVLEKALERLEAIEIVT